MVNNLVERQIESAVEDLFDDKTARIVKGVTKIAKLQGGDTHLQNALLLGKRTLIVAGAVIVVAQVATTAIGLIALHKTQEKRIERTVRRVLEEERQKEEGKTTVFPRR